MRSGMLRAMLVVLALAASAAALDLDDAKAAGLVGEKADGYVAVVGMTHGHARSLQLRVMIGARESSDERGAAARRASPFV